MAVAVGGVYRTKEAACSPSLTKISRLYRSMITRSLSTPSSAFTGNSRMLTISWGKPLWVRSTLMVPVSGLNRMKVKCSPSRATYSRNHLYMLFSLPGRTVTVMSRHRPPMPRRLVSPLMRTLW